MPAPEITSRSFAAPPTPGFMDYAAQYLDAFLGAKKEKEKEARETASKEAIAVLPTFAAHGMVEPSEEGKYSIAGIKYKTAPWRPSTYGSVKNPLPGYEEYPGVYTQSDLSAYLRNQEEMSWREGKISPRMIAKEAVGSIFSTGKSTKQKLKEASELIKELSGTSLANAPTNAEAPQYEGALPGDQVFKDADGKWKVRRNGVVYPLVE